jgi:2-oxoglutarate ferredoxin oxidoreductase subunit beta
MDIPEGEMQEVTFQNGDRVQIRTLEAGYDPHNRGGALVRMRESMDANEMLTGIIFVDEHKKPLKDLLELSDTPLVEIPNDKLRPPKEALDEILTELRTGH